MFYVFYLRSVALVGVFHTEFHAALVRPFSIEREIAGQLSALWLRKAMEVAVYYFTISRVNTATLK
jgi:hypothetical protein